MKFAYTQQELSFAALLIRSGFLQLLPLAWLSSLDSVWCHFHCSTWQALQQYVRINSSSSKQQQQHQQAAATSRQRADGGATFTLHVTWSCGANVSKVGFLGKRVLLAGPSMQGKAYDCAPAGCAAHDHSNTISSSNHRAGALIAACIWHTCCLLALAASAALPQRGGCIGLACGFNMVCWICQRK
jgi:hypothetical protein